MQVNPASRLRPDLFEAKLLAVIIALFGMIVAWQLSDREPRSKEMTFAYRKHFEAEFRRLPPPEQIRLRERNHGIELNKTGCEKVADDRYRCTAEVRVNDAPSTAHPEARKGIYTHDYKGWQYEAGDR